MEDRYIFVTGSKVLTAGNKTEVYDTLVNEWTELDQMPTYRYDHSSCAF